MLCFFQENEGQSPSHHSRRHRSPETPDSDDWDNEFDNDIEGDITATGMFPLSFIHDSLWSLPRGGPGGGYRWSSLVTNRPLVAFADRTRGQQGGPITDQVVSWVQFPIGAWSSHTKDVKNGSSSYLHGTQNEVGTMKHNWSAWCQYLVTGRFSMWAYDMLSQ